MDTVRIYGERHGDLNADASALVAVFVDKLGIESCAYLFLRVAAFFSLTPEAT